ncbi:class I SAM-dependent methyltransferase [Metallosphaera tengchongensis]|uniref:Class I SAM-dependent methyltransferase n=1 Tax=Metallosphaera tengchongensis TaxID=1532350 RepID=A0A6N0NW81_9CREN|nr:class I SAM-dependent methyltransferase [Metallosphaera tengchongensis]QKR00465.1 class I SAM-dependent methyltransferase [Metallosphaera tengchongensis]
MPVYYPVRRMGITLEEEEFIARRLQQISVDGEVLDVGCGNCMIPILLAKKWGKRIHAADIWDEFPMEQAMKNAKEEGVELTFMKISRPDIVLPFQDSSLEMVYSVMFVYNLRKEERQKLFSEVHRVLKKGGLFLIVDPVIVRRERKELVNFSEVSYREENALFYYLTRK